MVSAPEAVTCEATSHSSQVLASVEHHGIYQLVHPDMQMAIKLLTSNLQYILTHQQWRGEPIYSFNLKGHVLSIGCFRWPLHSTVFFHNIC